MRLTEADIERFWSKVDRRGPDECWPWRGPDKYGIFYFGGSREYSHRTSFFIANGHVPRLVRHTCDNPPCCNPAHLLAGSQSDNMRDAVVRGRIATKISDAAVLEIRSSTEKGVVLARRYGVAEGTISAIRLGKERRRIGPVA